MANEKERDGGKEATDAFKTLLARIGDIFGVFDLSFLVAGSVGFGALLFGGYVFGLWPKVADLPSVAKEWGAIHVAAIIVISYVIGIVCFSLGRSLHSSKFYQQLPDHLRDFGLHEHYRHLFRGVPEIPSGTSTTTAERSFRPTPAERQLRQRCVQVYTRLWAEARQAKPLAPSFNLLTRYWVIAAMCDGLTVAFSMWWLLWMAWMTPPEWRGDGTCPLRPAWLVTIPVCVALIGAARLCLRESQRYRDYQMYELIATLAFHHEKHAGAEESTEVRGAEDEASKAPALDLALNLPPRRPE